MTIMRKFAHALASEAARPLVLARAFSSAATMLRHASVQQAPEGRPSAAGAPAGQGAATTTAGATTSTQGAADGATAIGATTSAQGAAGGATAVGLNSVAHATSRCSRLPPAELTHILKLIYTAGARTDRKLSLAALDKRGAGALYATTLAALREGCLMAEKRQLLLELLRQNVSGNLRCSVQAALRHQAAASSSTSPAGASSDSAAAAAGASTTPTAAAMPGEDCAWYERRVRRLSREDLDSLMSGRWLRQLMALLTPRVKAGEWEEAVAAASRVSRTLGKVLRRTPCPALAPLEHTVQAVARALVDDGSVRRGPSPWPLKTRNIVALLLVYHELMRLPADRVLAGTGLPKAHLQRWLLDSIERVHVHRVVSRTALLRQVRATIMVFDKQQQRQ